MIIKATVTTNCEEDQYLRVKVQNTNFWAVESSLLSSVNAIYLNKGDIVIVDYLEDGSSIIIGKLLTKDQIDVNPVKGLPIIFQSQKDDHYIVGTLTSEEFKVTTDDNTTFVFKNGQFTVTTKEGLIVQLKEKKLSIKNDTASLFTLIDDLLQKLATTVPTTQGSPAAQNFNPLIITQVNQSKTDLNALLE